MQSPDVRLVTETALEARIDELGIDPLALPDPTVKALLDDPESETSLKVAASFGEELGTDWSPANVHLAPSRFNVRTKGALGLGADEHVAILSAVEDAKSAGGRVQWASGYYGMGSHPLPTPDGVTYDMVEPDQTQEVTGTDDYAANFLNVRGDLGTCLFGDGTAPGITDGHTDAGSYAADMDATASKGFRVEGGARLENFSVGLKVGAQNRIGMTYGGIDRLYVDRSCGAAAQLINVQEFRLGYLMDGGTVGGTIVGSNISPFVPGNSQIDKIYGMLPSVAQAGGADALRKYLPRLKVIAYDDSVLNEMIFGCVQLTGYNVTELSFTGTYTSGSPNIAVPAGTGAKLAVGMLFYTSGDSTYNGTDNRTFVVRSVAGDVMTLGYNHNDVRNAVSTGSTTFKTRGHPSLEVVGLDTGDRETATQFAHLDLEGDRIGAYFEDFEGFINFMEIPGSGVTSAVFRNSGGDVFSAGTMSTNLDTNSKPLLGFRGKLGTQEWATANGQYHDTALGQFVVRADAVNP